MAPRVFLWLAVASLTGLALANVVASAAGNALSGGYAYSTPAPASAPNRAMRVMNRCAYAEMFFVPVAAPRPRGTCFCSTAASPARRALADLN